MICRHDARPSVSRDAATSGLDCCWCSISVVLSSRSSEKSSKIIRVRLSAVCSAAAAPESRNAKFIQITCRHEQAGVRAASHLWMAHLSAAVPGALPFQRHASYWPKAIGLQEEAPTKRGFQSNACRMTLISRHRGWLIRVCSRSHGLPNAWPMDCGCVKGRNSWAL